MADTTEKVSHQNIPYTLTVVRNDKRAESIALPNNPSKVTWSEDFPTTVEYTLGDIPKREHNKPKRWTVELSGRTGVATRVMDDNTEKRPLTVLSEFIAFLEKYQADAAAMGATALRTAGSARHLYAGLYLVLDAYKEDIHLMVDVTSFSFDRDAATTRHSASWSLSLLGWKKVGLGIPDATRYLSVPNYAAQYASPEEGAIAEGWASADPDALNAARTVTPADWKATNNAILGMVRQRATARLQSLGSLAALTPKGTGGICGMFDSALRTINDSLGDANAAISKWSGAITKIQTYGLAFQRSMVDFRNTVRAGIDIVHMPQRILSDLANTTGILRETFYDLYYTGEYISSGMGLDAAWSMLLLSASAHEDAVVMVGSSGSKVKKTTYESPWITKTLPLTSADESVYGTTYVVPAGVSSWADISTQVYGDSSYWIVLAKFNGAYDGYSDAAGKPIQQGKLIYLPAPAGDLITGKSPSTDSYYLTDFLLDDSGDISMTNSAYLTGSGQVTDSTGAGDLQTVTGFANLIQAVTTLTRTPQGAISDRTDYGLLSVAPGDSLNPNKAATVMSVAQDQLRADFRIATVKDPAVILDTDSLSLQFTLIPSGANPEPLTVVAPVPTL